MIILFCSRIHKTQRRVYSKISCQGKETNNVVLLSAELCATKILPRRSAKERTNEWENFVQEKNVRERERMSGVA